VKNVTCEANGEQIDNFSSVTEDVRKTPFRGVAWSAAPWGRNGVSIWTGFGMADFLTQNRRVLQRLVDLNGFIRQA